MPEVEYQRQQLRPGHSISGCVVDGCLDRKAQPWVSHRTTADHQHVTPGYFAAAACVINGPDFAIGHDWNFDRCTDVGNPLPVRRWAVGLRFGASVHHQLVSAAACDSQGAFHRA